MDVEINYLAVFLAAVSTMVVGSVWYMPKVFGAAWAKMAKVNINRKMSNGEIAYMFGGTFVISLISAYVLAHFAYLSNSFYDNSFLQDALMTGFWGWLGFTAVRFATHDIFENRRKKLTLINVGNEFATIMVMAFIIGLMGV